MRINMVGLAVMSEGPTASGRWFADHFGFKVGVDLGWFVSTQHEDQRSLSLDFVQRDHESMPEALRGRRVAGTLLAFLVDDVDAEERRLRAAGLEFVLPLVTEPWGQRRFQVAAPDGLVVEVLQVVEPSPEWRAEHGA